MRQDTKDGCQPSEVAELVRQISQLPHLKLRGLMVIPAPNHPQAFQDAKQLFDAVKAQHAQPEDWDTLSMGMSGDFSRRNCSRFNYGTDWYSIVWRT